MAPVTGWSPVLALLGKTVARNTIAGKTDAGNTDAGNTDAGNTDAGNTEAGNTVSIALFDIDWFQAFNDAYGHGAGDGLIARVAELVVAATARHAPAQDFRVGADACVIVLHGAQAHRRAVLAAEEVRSALEHAAIEFVHPEVRPVRGRVTLSACVADAGADVEDVRAYLEELVFRAKRAGRNCVVDGDDGSLERGSDYAWVMIDVLTTNASLAAAGLAPSEATELVDVSDRLARRFCDVGLPHILVGEAASDI
jgi:diguanylate cyclase (GGDEF)-like protein